MPKRDTTIDSFFQRDTKRRKSDEDVPVKVPPDNPGATAAAAAAPAPATAAGQAPSLVGPAGDAMAALMQCKAAASKQPCEQLSAKELTVIADRNQAAAQAAVNAAKVAGGHPQLQQLLTEPSWAEALQAEFRKPYMRQLQAFLEGEWASRKVFPQQDNIFRALNSCPVDQVRVVVIGQDPYHDDNQAVGLSFSVPKGLKVPSSLQNIHKELLSDLGCSRPSHGSLVQWSHQGVLLLNAALTVRAHDANSHHKKGWEQFTSAALKALTAKRSGLVFLLWGRIAQEHAKGINLSKHHVLTAAHPSGLSASRGFFGCKHFSKCNALLQQSGMPAIDWQITNEGP